MTKYTPMMEQYLAVKETAKDAFLFFRLGDFYELFFDDAVRAAQELEITLTGRDGGQQERIPMCGVPYHAAENYIAKLVERGYKVAICEQVEDPATAKGVVRREIVKIVTPGTVMESRSLGEARNNYIACVAGTNGVYGLAACDLTTGELFVTVVEESAEVLIDELGVYSPSELVGRSALLEQLTGVEANGEETSEREPAAEAGAAYSLAKLVTRWEQSADADALSGQFPAAQLASLQPAQHEAVALLMGYLSETQKRALAHITAIQLYEHRQSMTLDPFTRRNLELVETVRERTKKGSLLWLLDRTVTSMGGRLLRRWVDKPLLSRAKIEERLEAVETLYNKLIDREELRQQLKEVYDLQRLVGRIAYGNANARDMLALRVSLEQVPALKASCLASGSSTLRALAESLDEVADLRDRIAAAIVDEPPVSVREGGFIREGYHSYLDQLKEASSNGKLWLAELEKRERELTGVKTLKIGFNKVFGYFLEASRASAGSLPADRYERKQTLANAERYVTPELKEKETLILEAEEKMVGLEYELFQELRQTASDELKRLQRLAEAIATIDALQSLAAVSAAYRYVKPELADSGALRVEEGRHPVVEAILKQGAFMANDTALSEEDGLVMLITGPNMAGKSTYMRQVATICIMAQIGCFVPAARARIPIIDRIFTRIGAADDLVGGQSTFMVEMMDIQAMTAKATPRSLVIIDELGRGTSTGEGMAIAQAVIEFLHDRIGCRTLVSTHFHELAHLEERLPSLRNYCMAVKESGQQVTFLRRLIRGAASTSYGIYCARIAGLPDPIIERAYSLLGEFESRGALRQARDEAAAGQAQPAGAPPLPPQAPDAAPAVQLSLFGGEPAAPPPNKLSKREAAAAAAADKLYAQLRSADLINMTPMQAMNLLYELQRQTQER
ncbi:DNA mismatch repair protein MutS [Paenibacillus koleovorans]|uniref:DNA mismatch repair protein MutS n=1 Tax=Paenibacillus koleovorans TaxID=121608 RepID=UPI000FD7DFF4|nr:DNA mismatch repair protein MutS [Paenibacillus koleovorans]